MSALSPGSSGAQNEAGSWTLWLELCVHSGLREENLRFSRPQHWKDLAGKVHALPAHMYFLLPALSHLRFLGD